jgi:hypothetical protein
MCIAGLNDGNIDYVAESIADVLKRRHSLIAQDETHAG